MRLRVRRNFRTAVPISVALVVVALVMFVPAARRGAVGLATPVLQIASAGAAAFRRIVRAVLPVSRGERSQLESLKRTVQGLRVDVSRLAPLAAENRELRRRLGVPAPADWTLVPAPVLARDPLSWNRRFRVGRGRIHGVEPGLPVWGLGGVIGRVAESTQTTALVITLADPACRLCVRLPQSGGTGILHGGGGNGNDGVPLCFIDYLPRDLPYREGEPVTTCGLGGATPEGLPVGTVMRLAPNKLGKIVHTAYTRLRVRPAAEFQWFRFVSILVPRQPIAPVSKKEAP